MLLSFIISFFLSIFLSFCISLSALSESEIAFGEVLSGSSPEKNAKEIFLKNDR